MPVAPELVAIGVARRLLGRLGGEVLALVLLVLAGPAALLAAAKVRVPARELSQLCLVHTPMRVCVFVCGLFDLFRSGLFLDSASVGVDGLQVSVLG